MSLPLTSGRQYILFLIKFTALCFCLYHFKYSDPLSNLKSAAKSIKVIFFDKCFESMPNNCHLVIVDVDEGSDIASSMRIKQVPTFLNFINGDMQDVYSSSGEAQVHEFMTKTFNRINGTLE